MSTEQPAVSAEAEKKIEHQRGRLQKASSILLCAVLAAREGVDVDDVADAAGVARELIDAAVKALDSVALARACQGGA